MRCRERLLGCMIVLGMAASVTFGAGNYLNPKTDFSLKPANAWTVADGILKTAKTGSLRADIKSSKGIYNKNWELKFKIKVIDHGSMGLNSAFCVDMPGSPDRPITRLQCVRGNRFRVRQCLGRVTLEAADIPWMPEQIKEGEDTAWVQFRLLRRNDTVKLYVDGKYIGGISNYKSSYDGKIGFLITASRVWITDVSLKVFGTARVKKSPVRAKKPINRVPNSGFEQCTQDNLPDYWGTPHWGIIDNYWVLNFEQWKKNFRTDTTEFYEGKRSMRIHSPFDNPKDKPYYSKSLNANGLCLRSVLLKTQYNVDYVLSAYMKSNPSGMKVNIGGTEVTLTETWQRYEVKFRRRDHFYSDMVNIYPLSKGTFWVDAVQLEEGTKATPYTHIFLII